MISLLSRVLACDGTDPLWKCARGGLGRGSGGVPLPVPSPGPASNAVPVGPLAALQQATFRGRPPHGSQSLFQQGYVPLNSRLH